ncbi:MAG TPA: hypothetical protein VLL76_03585 [Candidatus Omnitrophota bacterium]|nr:hypothetical protein [Candidatus Omnitrophota bacterium]
MRGTCPFCNSTLPTHGQCCRVPDDLDRFARVYERLQHEHRNEFLQDNLVRYLEAFGRDMHF